jgi:hypothetical protein
MAVTILKRDSNRYLDLTLDNVKDDLRQIYASIKQNKRSLETALISKHKFKNQFRGLCRACGKIGHKVVDCWTNEISKHKRPNNYKPNRNKPNGTNEAANIVTNTDKF